MRQNRGDGPASYSKILSELGTGPERYLKLFTLGAPAHICKNIVLGLSFAPRMMGHEAQHIWAVFSLGALLLSHPFEVARVLLVAYEKEHITG